MHLLEVQKFEAGQEQHDLQKEGVQEHAQDLLLIIVAPAPREVSIGEVVCCDAQVRCFVVDAVALIHIVSSWAGARSS